ncbi:hypothetical protein CASFOL_014743 [Castilleja foliolosa]|uniref:KIB1-4 beta-propeller domain-containing protein n=1 Tax=Castilleja foliolosa TaxID=1961234 RepID=A0ABD3DG01_9LAMI
MTMSTGVDSSPPSSRKISPWLMLPPVIEDGGEMVYKFYNLSEEKEESFLRNSGKEMADDAAAKFVGSSHGWLALFNERNNNHLFLYNPITRRYIKLPPIETLPDPMINLTHDGRGIISKLILSSSPDDDDECIAMMTFGPGDRLAICQPCRSTEWTPIGESFFECGYENVLVVHGGLIYGRAYEDFVYCNRLKRFICLMQLEFDLVHGYLCYELEDWDLNDPHSPASVPRNCDKWNYFRYQGGDEWINQNLRLLEKCRQIPYLILADSQLFIVHRFIMDRVAHDGSYVHVGEIPYDPISRRLLVDAYPHKTFGFSVLKVVYIDHEDGRRDVKVSLVKDSDSLDGLTMFVGMSHSFAVSSSDFPNLKPNSIYFTDANKHDNSMYGGHDIGIFDFANKTLSDCYCYPGVDVPSFKRIVPPPMWFTPSLY